MSTLSKKQLSLQDYCAAFEVCQATKIDDLLRIRRQMNDKKIAVSDAMKKALQITLDKKIKEKDFSF